MRDVALWTCTKKECRGLPDRARDAWRASKGDPDLWDDDREDLLELSDWLAVAGCTHVAMESTGVYWKPIYNLLEGAFTPLLLNARHIKAVPGRKTDVKDCEWIADLYSGTVVCSGAASCPNDPKGSCANSTATGRPWCGSAQLR
jgi:transposase